LILANSITTINTCC